MGKRLMRERLANGEAGFLLRHNRRQPCFNNHQFQNGSSALGPLATGLSKRVIVFTVPQRMHVAVRCVSLWFVVALQWLQ
jgi:hypothetical protein